MGDIADGWGSAVGDASRMLSERQRALVGLTYFGELPLARVAARLDLRLADAARDLAVALRVIAGQLEAGDDSGRWFSKA